MNNPEITPELIIDIGKSVKAKARKLTVRYTIDSKEDMVDTFAIGDDDPLVHTMANGIKEALYEDILWPVILHDAGVFVIR